jgi:hypothetical protein
MAKGRKTGGRDFAPGDPRAGRKPIPEDVKAIRKLTILEFQRLINKYLWLSEEGLQVAMQDPACSMLEKLVASVIAKGISQGDPMRMEALVTRLVGKVTDKVEVKIPKPYVVHHLDGTQTVLASKVEDDGEGESSE